MRNLIFFVSCASLLLSACTNSSTSKSQEYLAGSKARNPGGNPSRVAILIGGNVPASITQISLRAAAITLYPADSTQANVTLAVTDGALNFTSGAVQVTSALLQPQAYSKIEILLSPADAASKSLTVTNTSGSFSVAEPITLKFNGTFSIESTSHAIQLDMNSFVSGFSSVTSDPELKTTVETTSGTGDVLVNDVTSGLVAEFKFDEGAGSSTVDSGPSALAGSLMSGALWGTGRYGSALLLDGVDDYVDLGSPAELDFDTRSFTYSLWVNVAQLVGPYAMPIWKGGSSTSYPGFDIEINASNWYAYLSDGTSLIGAPFGIQALNQWQMLTTVVDRGSSELRVYVNGLRVNATSIAALGSISSSIAARVGASDQAAPTSPVKGMIDDMRFYNRALTDLEIKSLYSR